ncbi:MAG: hypothetical protein R3C11_06090 [Planctomycetaceae bacterium]
MFITYVANVGHEFRNGLAPLAAEFGMPLKFIGHPAITSMVYDHPQAAEIRITVRMLDEGILAGAGLYASLAHRSEHIQRYL